MSRIPSQGSMYMAEVLVKTAQKFASGGPAQAPKAGAAVLQTMGNLMGLPWNAQTMQSEGAALQAIATWIDGLCDLVMEARKETKHLDRHVAVMLAKRVLGMGNFAPEAWMVLGASGATLGLDLMMIVGAGGLVAFLAAESPVLIALGCLGLLLDVASAGAASYSFGQFVGQLPAHPKVAPPALPRRDGGLEYIARMRNDLVHKQFYFWQFDPSKPFIWYYGS